MKMHIKREKKELKEWKDRLLIADYEMNEANQIFNEIKTKLYNGVSIALMVISFFWLFGVVALGVYFIKWEWADMLIAFGLPLLGFAIAFSMNPVMYLKILRDDILN